MSKKNITGVTINDKIVVLYETENITGNRGYLSKIISYNKKKFKIVSDVFNGYQLLDVYVMVDGGEFKLILNKDEIGHEYFITHSSDVTSKRHDMLKGVKLAESVLMKIY